MLLSITFFPWIFPNFWKKNSNKALTAFAWSIPILFYFHSDFFPLFHTARDYFSFICLIGSLFVVCGGIFLRGNLKAQPSTNLCFLGLGAVLANIIGTTGASMILVRSFLKTNSERQNTWHLPLFFIFTVSNFGGLLTPLGDPPLFLGYLNGVPFSWTLRLLPPWLVAISILLLIFYGWDRWAYRRETPKAIALDESKIEPLRLKGKRNLFFLGGIVGAVFLPTPWRETAMIFCAAFSYRSTPKKYYRENLFGFHPIEEVAYLFAGIFITMTPLLQILEIRGPELNLTQPWQFFWIAGALSSFLDNAPTYLTFFHLAKGLNTGMDAVAGVPEVLLKAISMGSVFMGANSYIGNGPNFMVKAIADEQGFKTLSFGAYLLMAILILFPIYFLLTWIFF